MASSDRGRTSRRRSTAARSGTRNRARAASRNRTGAPSASALDPVPAVAQLPWRTVVNHHGTLDVLDVDGVEAIHDASLHILADHGIQVWSDEARRLFEHHGAILDDDLVRIGPDMVEAALSSAPSTFTLTPPQP